MGDINRTTTAVDQAMNEQLDGDPVLTIGWDDIQGVVAEDSFHPATTPTWHDYDYNLGGVTFKTLGFDVGNVIYGTIQTPHVMKLNSELHLHLHISTPTDAVGSYCAFQLDVIACGVDVIGVDRTYSIPTGSPFTIPYEFSKDLRSSQTILELGIIDSVNTTVSTLYKLKLTRVATAGDYTGEVYVDALDGHYQIDQDRGSREEYNK